MPNQPSARDYQYCSTEISFCQEELCDFVFLANTTVFLSRRLFVRSDVVWNVGRVSPNAGTVAVFWSSRTYSNAAFQHTFFLYFTASGVVPSDINYRWHGFPLRCLVR